MASTVAHLRVQLRTFGRGASRPLPTANAASIRTAIALRNCDQVSDWESWQERLASHLCEPGRNFGVSGNTLYQAYTRTKRAEARTPAKYLIFNLHGGGLWGSESP
jgi:hypothetical protein